MTAPVADDGGFREAVRLEPRGAGRYARTVDADTYWGMVTPHGGYLMALMLAAMEREVDDPARRPRGFTQHFLGTVAPGEVGIEVETLHASRSVSSLSARMTSDGRVAGLASAIFTAGREGPSFLDEPAPDVAPMGDGDAAPPSFVAPVHREFEFARRFGADGRVEPVEDGGWLRPRRAEAWNHPFVLMASDLWIPPIIRHPDRVAATPSLHHVVHFGPQVEGPAGSPLLVRHRLAVGGDGVTDEDIALWAEDGRLLLRGRQLRLAVAGERMAGWSGGRPLS